MPDTATTEATPVTIPRVQFLRSVQAGDVYQNDNGRDRVRYNNGGGSFADKLVRAELAAKPGPTIYLAPAKVYRLTQFGDQVLAADDRRKHIERRTI